MCASQPGSPETETGVKWPPSMATGRRNIRDAWMSLYQRSVATTPWGTLAASHAITG